MNRDVHRTVRMWNGRRAVRRQFIVHLLLVRRLLAVDDDTRASVFILLLLLLLHHLRCMLFASNCCAGVRNDAKPRAIGHCCSQNKVSDITRCLICGGMFNDDFIAHLLTKEIVPGRPVCISKTNFIKINRFLRYRIFFVFHGRRFGF